MNSFHPCLYSYPDYREECYEYTELTDPGRGVSHVAQHPCCDNAISKNGRHKCSDWKGAGWYRMNSAAGTRIPEKTPVNNHCNTHWVGWVNGVHPKSEGESITVQICFRLRKNHCHQKTTGKITNCGDYFVYYLEPVEWCHARYCITK